MSEIPGQVDPFEHAIQSGFSIPAIDSLPLEQQMELYRGPGAVIYPVTAGILDVESFDVLIGADSHMDVLNNFFMQYTLDRYDAQLPEELQGITVPFPATRRFQAIFPDLARQVDEAVARHTKEDGITVDTTRLDQDRDALKKLYVAYKYTRQLVDARDDEIIDPRYLIQ